MSVVGLSGFVHEVTGLPSLRFTVAAGVRGELVGSHGQDRWVLWSGVGSGGEVVLSDPLAPLGVEVSYSLGGERVRLTRPALGAHAVSDESGRVVARVVLAGDDSVSHESGVSTLNLASGVADRWLMRGVPDEVQLVCRTSGDDTAALRALCAYRGSVIVLHDPTVCEVEGCDIPLVRRCVVVSGHERRSERTDVAVREWDVKLSDRSRGVWRGGVVVSSSAPNAKGGGGFAAPAVTWGEWQKLDGGWRSRTYLELCKLIGGMG